MANTGLITLDRGFCANESENQLDENFRRCASDIGALNNKIENLPTGGGGAYHHLVYIATEMEDSDGDSHDVEFSVEILCDADEKIIEEIEIAEGETIESAKVVLDFLNVKFANAKAGYFANGLFPASGSVDMNDGSHNKVVNCCIREDGGFYYLAVEDAENKAYSKKLIFEDFPEAGEAAEYVLAEECIEDYKQIYPKVENGE